VVAIEMAIWPWQVCLQQAVDSRAMILVPSQHGSVHFVRTCALCADPCTLCGPMHFVGCTTSTLCNARCAFDTS
jgi:hypothetical protein